MHTPAGYENANFPRKFSASSILSLIVILLFIFLFVLRVTFGEGRSLDVRVVTLGRSSLIRASFPRCTFVISGGGRGRGDLFFG